MNLNHCIFKFNNKGELKLTIGTPGKSGEKDGDPFNLPTDLAIASTGELYISDGYGNHRVHKYNANGEDFTIEQIGAVDASLALSDAGTGVDAIVISAGASDATKGGIDIEGDLLLEKGDYEQAKLVGVLE